MRLNKYLASLEKISEMIIVLEKRFKRQQEELGKIKNHFAKLNRDTEFLKVATNLQKMVELSKQVVESHGDAQKIELLQAELQKLDTFLRRALSYKKYY
jgi:protein subunit release factor A